MPPAVRTKKPTWGWKARNSAELADFDVAFSVKEYIQNQVGQVLKEMKVREWSDWNRTNYTGLPRDIRQGYKTMFADDWPGLMTGPHGAALKRRDDWLPVYKLSARIPNLRLKATPYKTDLLICTVVWKHETSGLLGLSFYNNHLDKDADFESFVVDGKSTSRANPYAIGEKGKGFSLATQYFVELIEGHIAGLPQVPPEDVHPGVSFRVGHRIGEFSVNQQGQDQLRVSMDDLTPTDSKELNKRLKSKVKEESGDESAADQVQGKPPTPAKVLKMMYERRFSYGLAEKRPGAKEACKPSDENSLVSEDEVVISILGLNIPLNLDDIFSAILGIIPPTKSWKPTPDIDFAILDKGNQKFFLRDQFVPSGPPVRGLSINYHGNLRLSSDRTAVLQLGGRYDRYQSALSTAAHVGFNLCPKLAHALALDVLREQTSDGKTVGHVLEPEDTSFSQQYVNAFGSAWRELDPSIPADAKLWPCTESSKEAREIREIGMEPRLVKEHVRTILEDSGAYPSLMEYLKEELCNAPAHPTPPHGLDRYENGLDMLLGEDPPSWTIEFRTYAFARPKVVWNEDSETLILAAPKPCPSHSSGKCLCWVAGYLLDTVKALDSLRDFDSILVGQAIALAVEGIVDMHEPEDDSDEDESAPSRSSPVQKGKKRKAKELTLDDLVALIPQISQLPSLLETERAEMQGKLEKERKEMHDKLAEQKRYEHQLTVQIATLASEKEIAIREREKQRSTIQGFLENLSQPGPSPKKWRLE